jgi:hypothetical protein
VIHCHGDKIYLCLVGIGLKVIAPISLNPIPTRICHVIYCHGDKSYPCLVGIGLIINPTSLHISGFKFNFRNFYLETF